MGTKIPNLTCFGQNKDCPYKSQTVCHQLQFQKDLMNRFWKKNFKNIDLELKNAPFLPFSRNNKNFPLQKGSVTFKCSLKSKILQKIRKNNGGYPEKTKTDRQTDGQN